MLQSTAVATRRLGVRHELARSDCSSDCQHNLVLVRLLLRVGPRRLDLFVCMTSSLCRVINPVCQARGRGFSPEFEIDAILIEHARPLVAVVCSEDRRNISPLGGSNP